MDTRNDDVWKAYLRARDAIRKRLDMMFAGPIGDNVGVLETELHNIAAIAQEALAEAEVLREGVF